MAAVQPKKPVGGAFGVFTNEKRPEFMKACQGQPVSAVSKMAGEAWKELSDADKEPYQKKYEENKAIYEKEMAEFLASGGVKTKGAAALRSEKKAAKAEKLAKKDLDAPKKPAGGGYGRYLAEKRDEIKAMLPADHKITDVAKKAGELWKALSEQDKEKYQAEFAKAMEKYSAEFAAYKESKKSEAVEEDKAEDEEGADETPAPKKRASDAKGGKPAKIAKIARRGRPSKPDTKGGVAISDSIMAKAKAAGHEDALKNLASRPDVIASGKNDAKLFKALQSSNGLVNAAKRALLGA